jgi:hypothetical protein
VVVVVGETAVEPLAAVEVNALGVMLILVAPVVDQLSVLLEPEVILVGLAVKEAMVGLETVAVTVTVAVAVTEPALLAAVSV